MLKYFKDVKPRFSNLVVLQIDRENVKEGHELVKKYSDEDGNAVIVITNFFLVPDKIYEEDKELSSNDFRRFPEYKEILSKNNIEVLQLPAEVADYVELAAKLA